MQQTDMIRMANQISDFFKSYTEEEAINGIADHISKFWEPGIRKAFLSHVEEGGHGFSALVIKSAPHVKRPKSA